nr:MAG TPA: hypothetical protein [Caudoviricetes sp.]
MLKISKNKEKMNKKPNLSRFLKKLKIETLI